jgi:predicted O-methyltransferase YrrM
MDGRVLDPAESDSAAVVARLNGEIASDPRVEIAMIAVADGLTLARKR